MAVKTEPWGNPVMSRGMIQLTGAIWMQSERYGLKDVSAESQIPKVVCIRDKTG